MKKYKHIFFDLDRTLWDFEGNSLATFIELYDKYALHTRIPSPEDLFKAYYKHNEALWDLFRNGGIGKDDLRIKRFVLTLNDFGVYDYELATTLGEDYLAVCPTKTHLVPDSIEILNALSTSYFLHILTNGFPEVQNAKLECSGLGSFFSLVITSEEAGWQKPDIRIFQYAACRAGAGLSECLMVGDDLEVDIIGARNAGMDQVYFNRDGLTHDEKVSYEIESLNQLLSIRELIIQS